MNSTRTNDPFVDQRVSELSVSNCNRLVGISGFINDDKSCEKLESLDISRCGELDDISQLTFCPNLRKLNVTNCTRLRDISSLSACTQLHTVDISVTGVTNVSALTHKTLHTIDLSNTDVENISSIAACKNLHTLRLLGCTKVKDTTPLSQCTKLHTILLSGCKRLKNLPSIPNLHTFKLPNCSRVTCFFFVVFDDREKR